MDKLKSRKFWMALVGACIPILASAITGDIETNDAVMQSVAVVMAYIFGQGYVDGKALEGKPPPLEA